MDHVQGQDRDQMMMISLEQMVHKESFVRVIDAFVDALDLQSFGFLYYTLNKEGRPPFHPGDLLKLYLFGYQRGIRSCRKLEYACKDSLEVMWLMKGRQPHYKTIAKFRKDNNTAFRDVFRAFVSIMKEWNLVEGKHIAIDSFKIRAQNSLKNNYNDKKIDRHLQYIDNKINDYLLQLEDEDKPETRDLIEKKIKHQARKADKYLLLSKKLENENLDQISTTDPDAKAVILHRNIVNVGYNIQAASDRKHKMIVAIDTGDVNDTHALSPMVERVQQNMDIQHCNIIADKGYHTGEQLTQCEQLKATTYISPKANAANDRYKVFPMEQFKYHPGSDTYRCPNQSILRSNGNYYNRRSKNNKSTTVRFKQYKTKECKDCPLKDQCTTSKGGRVIQRSEHQSAIDRNNKRVNKDPDYYRQRQQIIEHQFGTLKRQWHFDHVLMRGKENVLAEVSIAFTAYNLRRATSILGVSELILALKGLFGRFILILVLRSCVVHHIATKRQNYNYRIWRSIQQDMMAKAC